MWVAGTLAIPGLVCGQGGIIGRLPLGFLLCGLLGQLLSPVRALLLELSLHRERHTRTRVEWVLVVLDGSGKGFRTYLELSEVADSELSGKARDMG